MIIKKRNIIACLIALLVLGITNSFWLKVKPVDVTFNIESSDVSQAKISAKLSGKIFHSKKKTENFDLSKSNKIKLKITNIINFNKAVTIIKPEISVGVPFKALRA